MTRYLYVAGILYAELQILELPIVQSFFRRTPHWVRVGIGVASITVGLLPAIQHRHTGRHTSAEDADEQAS